MIGTEHLLCKYKYFLHEVQKVSKFLPTFLFLVIELVTYLTQATIIEGS